MQDEWDILQDKIGLCARCALGKTRTQAVMGSGEKTAKILLVGEGPGQQEDLRGEAFVGPAGQLLDRMLASIGLTRRDVYIANVVKCRPPGNRAPLPEEAQACLPFLRQQVRLLRPKIIVALGASAARVVLNPQIRISRERGQWVYRRGVWMMATFHPSYLLRQPQEKRAAWEDLKGLREKMRQLEIQTERQEKDGQKKGDGQAQRPVY